MVAANIFPPAVGLGSPNGRDPCGGFDGRAIVQSINFEFIRDKWPELASLGGFAEQYVAQDPTGGTVKLRAFAEQAVRFIYDFHGLPTLFQANLFDLLTATAFELAVPRVICSKFHELRLQGNKAAHGATINVATAHALLREAFDVARWLATTYGQVLPADLPAFQELPTVGSGATAPKAQQILQAKLLATEAQMTQLLAELDSRRASERKAQANNGELEAAKARGQRTADVLQFDEDTTRKRLIDLMLLDAGWEVGNAGQSTATVDQELEVLHQPTETGIGYADYVLWGDAGKTRPLAVVEVKKTAKDAGIGREQAKFYTDGLEKMTGQRPIIFYSNGLETWIWNDAANEPPRRVFGFYAKDSLEYRVWQQTNRKPAGGIRPDPEIAGRMYQLEAIKRITERFAAKHQAALAVLATGTGKTRVAVSLSDALIKAGWARRILFLCDRVELRNQARDAFKEYLPSEPFTLISNRTSDDRNSRIYLGTYPGLIKCFEDFDVGFFDLIIFDESHRSIYNRYRDLVLYFDCYKLGLTATPMDLIAHNTYLLFGCENGDPTALFTYEEALKSTPPYLVPFQVQSSVTPFMETGIKYSQMSPEQRAEVEEQQADPTLTEHEASEIDKRVFNKDTNRHVLRNVMENGIRIKEGSQIGKTIIFARNHNHAVFLQNLFDEMYPELAGKFARVIDNYDPRADLLIREFKQLAKPLTIAISVDMLDTGIDVPEVVNLVFAKPVRSKVKFWQMIGRGTRLCRDLFGPGQHKTHFLIFDHWKNFEFFDMLAANAAPAVAKSLREILFESRISLAEAALAALDMAAFDIARQALDRDIRDLPSGSIAVKEHARAIAAVKGDWILKNFEPITQAALKNEIAPLMRWCDVDDHIPAYKFDNLIAKMQIALLQKAAKFDDYKSDLLAQIDGLETNINQVQQRADLIATLRGNGFWPTVTVQQLEQVREQMRGIMQYGQVSITTRLPPKVLDIHEDQSLILHKEYQPRGMGLEFVQYRQRVEKVLLSLFDSSSTLQKIRDGQPVGEADLRALVSLVLTQDPNLDLRDLQEYYPEAAGHLDLAIRGIVGLNADVVARRFEDFCQRHPTLNSRQTRFLRQLQDYIGKYGSIKAERLYEDPFTVLDSKGPDGLFPDARELDELFAVIRSFETARGATGRDK